MGFWKIVGGIAAGVGAVALLPVAGAVGAVTATGALVGGAVGAVVAAGTDDSDEKKRLRAENQRVAAQRAAESARAEKAVAESREKVAVAEKKAQDAAQRASDAEKSLESAAKMMEQYRASLKDVEKHYQLVIALTAIGMAAANADGSVDESETAEMDEYISGIAALNLPAKVKARIEYLHHHPPTFDAAMEEVTKLDRNGLPLDAFRQLIVDVIGADGVVVASEKIFLARWDHAIAGGLEVLDAKLSVAEVDPPAAAPAVVEDAQPSRAKPVAKKAPAKKAPAAKPVAKKASAKKTPAAKPVAKKAPAKKTSAANPVAKKAPAKKNSAAKPVAKKAPAKKRKAVGK